MAAALDSLVDLAVSTDPKSQINLHSLNDLLHSMVRWLSVSGQGQRVPAAADSTLLAAAGPSSSGKPGTGAESTAVGDGVDGAGAQSRGHDGQDGGDRGISPSQQGRGSPTTDSGVSSPCLYALSKGEVRGMENKLKTLESRLDTLNSLEELQKRVTDGATPLADMWNFATITRRLEAAEEGIAKVCSMMDSLAKELHSLQQQNRSDEMAQRLSGLADDLALLQGSDRADSRSKLQSIADELSELKTDVNENYAKCEDLGDLVTWQALEDALKSRIPEPSAVPVPAPEPMTRMERIKSAKKASPSREAVEALRQVGSLSSKHTELVDNVSELENALAGKLTAEDIANLAPKEHVELLAQLQARVSDLEDQIGKDMKKEFTDLRELVNQLKEAAEASSAVDAQQMQKILTSHLTNEQLIKDMAEQMGKLRDQVSLLEKLLDEVQNASKKPREDTSVSADMVEGVRTRVDGLKDEQQLLHDALTKLLQEFTESKQHLQNLYQSVTNLDQVKADKEFVASEVGDKADRQSVDDMASRTWVDNHIHQLTQEILQAKDQVSGHDEQLRGALERLTTDVDSKMDRLELEPLKQYLESKIQKNTRTVVDDGSGKQADGDWDAAGMRRALLKFHCISCDRPVLMKADGPVHPLPVAGSMRPQKVAVRPANLHELEAMRDQQRRFVNAQDMYNPAPYLPSLRSCGGGHTLTHPSRRARVVPPIVNMYGGAGDQLVSTGQPPVERERDVLGLNGQVYKGRNFQNHLPQISPYGARVTHPPRRPAKSAKSSRALTTSDDKRPLTSMDVTPHSRSGPT